MTTFEIEIHIAKNDVEKIDAEDIRYVTIGKHKFVRMDQFEDFAEKWNTRKMVWWRKLLRKL